MAKREFLQLAHTYKPKKYGIGGWFVSEKLDGMRCFWDGGQSRGKLATEVPWANTEKDYRYVTPPVATGLWTRYGKVIHAPDWFLNSLPDILLDGELYCGRNGFQTLMSAAKQLVPDDRWNQIRYCVFDSPPASVIFADGIINNTNFKKEFKGIGYTAMTLPASQVFQDRYLNLCKLCPRLDEHTSWYLHDQIRLPFKTADAESVLEKYLDGIIDCGGEGVILKAPGNLWLPERSHTMLKHKAVHDAEGTVTGYTWGRETDKGSKLLGLMGAMILEQENGRTLELSGFTDAERRMVYMDGYDREGNPANLAGGQDASDFGIRHPGAVVPLHITNPAFPRGSKVTYRYRELTDDGVAKEARFWRKA